MTTTSLSSSKTVSFIAGLLLFLALPAQAVAQSASCQIVLGFATLAAAIPEVGQCKENQRNASNGDALQQTSGGLLVWRKADNWTAFTDGFQTWLNGPNGIERRLNTERFDWEAELPSTNPSPPAAPPALLTGPIVHSDSGDKVIQNVVLPAGLLQTESTCGPCNYIFFVDLIDDKGHSAADLAFESPSPDPSGRPGSFAGKIATHIDAGTYSLKITARGSWKVTLSVTAPLTSAPGPGSYAGRGAGFFPVTLKAGPIKASSTYSGSDSLYAYLKDAEGTRIFSTLADRRGVGKDDETATIRSSGVYILQVDGSGDWTIALSQ